MIKTLQSLRFIFILLVFISHIPLCELSFGFGGDCGVSFFFILSGFVLSVGYGAKIEQGKFRTRPFFLRQLLKLYPLHILTMAAVLLLNMRLGRHIEPEVLLSNIFLLQSWFPDKRFYFAANAPSWFLSDMIFFYLMFPLLYKKIVKGSIKNVSAAATAVLLLWTVISFSVPADKINAILYVSPMTRLIDFAIGIMLYRIYRSDITEKAAALINSGGPLTEWVTELIAVAAILFAYAAYQHTPVQIKCSALFWPSLAIFIYLFSIADRHGSLLTKFLRSKAMMWLGSISFEFYMVHMTVLRLAGSALRGIGSDPASPLLLLVTLPATVLTAFITKKYFVDKIYSYLIKYVV